MKNVLIFCGGMSAEHEISIVSSRGVIREIDRSKFNPILVTVSRSGTWYFQNEISIIDTMTSCEDVPNSKNIATLIRFNQEAFLMIVGEDYKLIKVDIAFPLIHGPIGEDGSLQGMFEVMNLPYVGSNVTSSALCMDKDFMKKILIHSGIPVTPFITYSRSRYNDTHYDQYFSYEAVSLKLNSKILFIKPSIMGSSIGISKVKCAEDYYNAIEIAFMYSDKILIEKFVEGHEIECAVLGNHDASVKPIASCVGEIKHNSNKHEFYSYEAKYFDEDGAELIMPANIAPDLSDNIRDMALKAYTSIGCNGLARVDFFVTDDNEIYVNELNTLPGFTPISMYPKLWNLSGINYTELITRLIECGFDVYNEKQKLSLKP